jgi:hypothetical protein
MGLQASALSQLMNPSVLRRVYDNELRTKADVDVLTMNELMNTITKSIWSELDNKPNGKRTEREPAISSLRRNLQAEHVDRLFDLANSGRGSNAAMKPIANLAAQSLKDLHKKLADSRQVDSLDAYSAAHLNDMYDRIDRWVEGKYMPASAPVPTIFSLFGSSAQEMENSSGK